MIFMYQTQGKINASGIYQRKTKIPKYKAKTKYAYEEQIQQSKRVAPDVHTNQQINAQKKPTENVSKAA